MTERWRRELSTLPRLDDAEQAWRRAQRGPEKPDPMPSTGQRLAAGFVALSVFAGAVALALGAFGGGGGTPVGGAPEAVVLTFFRDPAQATLPTATMTVNGRTVEANGSGFSWDEDGGSSIVDAVDPLVFDEWFDVPPSAPITIAGDADEVRGQVDVCCDASSPPPKLYGLDLEAGATMPSEPGRYILEFSASWPQGGRTFYFPIRVVDASRPAGPMLLAALDAPAGGDMPSLDLAFGDAAASIHAQGGAWPGGPYAFTQELQAFPDSVPPGTSLGFADGAWTGVTVELRSDVPIDSPSVRLALTAGGPGLVSEPIDLPGAYVVEITSEWPQGTAEFTFSLHVDGEGFTPPPTASTSPGIAPVVPDVVGLPEQEAMAALNDVGLDWIVRYREVEGVDRWRVAWQHPPAGAIVDGDTVALVVATDITPLPAGATDALACPASAHEPFGGPRYRLQPAGEAFIRVNTAGIRDDDVVGVVADALPDGYGPRLWHVIRDGEVVAVVDYDLLDGVACVGSGIGGASDR
jgi:hypothetical protein